jgi:tRNA modification GTPase
VEKDGIARTERLLTGADLILHVIDANAPKPPHFDERAEDERALLLLNKSDLPEHPDWRLTSGLRISCREEDGLTGLEDAILANVHAQKWDVPSGFAINARHRDCLRRALASCDQARRALRDNLPPELIAIDLRGALEAVGEVIGHTNVEQILDALFANFCIGK